MNYMFVYCYNLTNLDLSSFDTRNVINVSCMFGDFYGIKLIKIKKDLNQKILNELQRYRYNPEIIDI